MKKTNKLLSLLLVLCLLCAPMLTIVANAAGMTAPASDTAAEEWHANWIWDDSKKGDTVTEYGRQQDLYSNTWMNFRKTVTLDQVPESVVAKIAVDSRYWLYKMCIRDRCISNPPLTIRLLPSQIPRATPFRGPAQGDSGSAVRENPLRSPRRPLLKPLRKLLWNTA